MPPEELPIRHTSRFQFLGIPPKGERHTGGETREHRDSVPAFPISRDPPEGGTRTLSALMGTISLFPISRDPPEGGTPSS